MGACEINWSAINGQYTVDRTNQRKVTVDWNDSPGAKGKLTATFTGCDIDANDTNLRDEPMG